MNSFFARFGFVVMVSHELLMDFKKLYSALIYVRIPVMAIVGWLYLETSDPLFLILVLTVLPGVILSSVAKWYDAKKNVQ